MLYYACFSLACKTNSPLGRTYVGETLYRFVPSSIGDICSVFPYFTPPQPLCDLQVLQCPYRLAVCYIHLECRIEDFLHFCFEPEQGLLLAARSDPRRSKAEDITSSSQRIVYILDKPSVFHFLQSLLSLRCLYARLSVRYRFRDLQFVIRCRSMNLTVHQLGDIFSLSMRIWSTQLPPKGPRGRAIPVGSTMVSNPSGTTNDIDLRYNHRK